MTSTDYLAIHSRAIHSAVISFMVRRRYSGGNYISYEDLRQTVIVALLEYLARCETDEQAQAFPCYTALHAMTEEVMRLQPLTGTQRTNQVKELLAAQPVIVGLEYINVFREWQDDIITVMDYKNFFAGLDTAQQQLVSMRMAGASTKQIAHGERVTVATIQFRLQRIRKQYGEQMS